MMKLSALLQATLLTVTALGHFTVKTYDNTIGTGVWPKTTNKQTVTIPYCFPTQDDRNDLELQVEDAKDEWMSMIDPPSEQSGHCFNGWAEVCDRRNNPVLCFDEHGAWNSLVNEDTVVIRRNDGELDPINDPHGRQTYATSVGYVKQGTYARHMIVVGIQGDEGVDMDNWAEIIEIAHEMGHIMGFMHEHERPDRDHWVTFNCKALSDYKDVRGRVDKKISDQELCSDLELMQKEHFSAQNFATTGRLCENADYSAEDYDYDSIMHYASESWYDGTSKNPKDMPIAKRKEQDSDDLEELLRNNQVSVGDYKGVKHLYPWPLCCDSEEPQGALNDTMITSLAVLPSTLSTIFVTESSASPPSGYAVPTAISTNSTELIHATPKVCHPGNGFC